MLGNWFEVRVGPADVVVQSHTKEGAKLKVDLYYQEYPNRDINPDGTMPSDIAARPLSDTACEYYDIIEHPNAPMVRLVGFSSLSGTNAEVPDEYNAGVAPRFVKRSQT